MCHRILVRHGESEYNIGLTSSLDSGLTEGGKKQISLTASVLSLMRNFTKHFTGHVSPYLRTLQTASIIQEKTGIDFKVTSGPREIMCIYDHALIGYHKDLFPNFDWSEYPEGPMEVFHETEEEYLERYENYLDSMDESHVLVVSHGIPVVTMMEILMGIRRNPSYYYYARNGSITNVDHGRLVWYDYIPGT